MEVNQFQYQKEFLLDAGSSLPAFNLEYTTLGQLNLERNNVVWITHALTANANPSEWWSGLVGEEKLFNPTDYFIVCVNALGSCYGSTGPLSINPSTGTPYYHDFPTLTIRDIVNSFDLLRIHLGIEKIHTLLGGSLGGQQAVEWAIKKPHVFEHLILIATNAQHSPWGIAFNESQRLAIQTDPTWLLTTDTAGLKGLKTARSIALLSYRNYETYLQTQADELSTTESFKAASYQNYQGEKLVERFNAYSYYQLSKIMDSHNVGRGRGGVQKALQQIQAKTLVVAIHSDILFPVVESEILAQGIPNSSLSIIESLYGHDGFLIETDVLEKKFKNFYSIADNQLTINNEDLAFAK